MTEETDRESQTEDPTEKRLGDAIDKGNVPIAREATLFGSLVATFLVLSLMGGWFVAGIGETLKAALAGAGLLPLDDREAAASYVVTLFRDCGMPMLAIMAIIAMGSIIASLLQNVPSIAGERITPKASRISPVAGWNRLFGRAGMIEFGKATFKLTAAGVILWILFWRDIHHLVSALAVEPLLLPQLTGELASGVLMPMLVLAAALAVVDLAWSRFRWRRDLRMSRQQVKEEFKEAEGDPQLKSRMRSLARQRSSRRMMEDLPRASMVITNPTHYAVALRYSREDGGAPTVIAKGVDHLAQRIREVAAEHEIPLIENRPLARSLYDQVEIDSQIPPEFYRAVAEIIHYLNNTGRLPRHARGG